MSFVINPYRFGGGAPATSVPTPLHWFDLDDDGTWADQGSGTAFSSGLTEGGTPTTTSSTVGSTSRTVCNLDRGDYLYQNTGGTDKSWDGTNNDQFSLSYWFTWDTLASSANYLVNWRGANDAAGRLFYSLLVVSTEVSATRVFDNENPSNNVEYYEDIPANEITVTDWHHICARYDGTVATPILRYYVDGVLKGTDSNASMSTFETVAMPFAIGALASGRTNAANHHDGLIGMVGIWDEDIGEDGVSHLYNAGDGRNYSELTIV